MEGVAARYEDVAAALLGRELVDPPGGPATPAQLPKAWTAALEAPLKLRLDHASTSASLEKKGRELRQRRE